MGEFWMHQSAASKLTMGSVVIGAFNAVTPKLEEQLQIITTTSLKGISVMTNTVLKYGSILFLCAVALLNQQLKYVFFSSFHLFILYPEKNPVQESLLFKGFLAEEGNSKYKPNCSLRQKWHRNILGYTWQTSCNVPSHTLVSDNNTQSHQSCSVHTSLFPLIVHMDRCETTSEP